MRKLNSLFMAIALFFSFSYPAIHAYNSPEDLFVEDTCIDTTLLGSWLDNVQFQTTRNQATPADIVSFLIDIGALNLVQTNVYRRTNPMNVRNVLDYPCHIPMKYSSSPWIVNTTIFYNYMNRNFFTRTSDSIESYLGIFDPNLLEFLSNEVLEELIRDQFPNFNLNPLDVLPLFKNMTIEERRIGIMIQGRQKMRRGWRFRFLLPLLYVENNFYLTPEEQNEIEIYFGQNPDQNTFADEYLISDKVGFGDLRLFWEAPVTDRSFFNLRAGFYITLPTACAFKRGLKGSYFRKVQQPPPFDFEALFNNAQGTPAQKQAAMQQGRSFFETALKHLSATLIEKPLGNGGYFSGACFVRYKSYLHRYIARQWAENVVIYSYMTLELFAPMHHARSFIATNYTAAFDALGLNGNVDDIKDRVEDDPAYAQQVLDFFDQQMTNIFFPYTLSARVWPGCIYQWTSKLHYEGIRWGVETGFDTWVRTPDSLSHIVIPPWIPKNINVSLARQPFAYQWKIFGSIFLKNNDTENKWLVGISGDYTLTNAGIGKDYTFALVFEHHF